MLEPIGEHDIKPLRTFHIVDNFSLVSFRHLRRIDTSIFNLAIDAVILLTVVGDSLQERCATGARTTKNQAHFARFQDTRGPEERLVS